MQLEQFFDLILSGKGRRVIAFKTKGGKFVHKYFTTSAAAARFASIMDAKGRTVYHACATYGPKDERLASNAVGAKSFWLDIDCGEGKAYRSAVEGIAAIGKFCKQHKFPTPLLVSSGGGVHVYWPMTQTIPAKLWVTYARMLKEIVQVAGLKADPSRTADLASILRPVTTHNYKYTKPVKVSVLKAGKETDAKELLVLIRSTFLSLGLGDSVEQALGERPAYVTGEFADELDTETPDRKPPPVSPILAGCAAIAKFKENAATLNEGQWYHGIGVLAHCEGGSEAIHEWSSAYAGYTRTETQSKIDQKLSVGPTTCKVMEGFYPDECAGCPLRGKIASPITIGYTDPVKEEEVEVVEDGVSTVVDLAPALMPEDFMVASQNGRTGLWHRKAEQNDDGEWAVKWEFVTPSIFYPIASLVDEDGIHEMEVRHIFRNNTKIREFRIENKIIGAGGRELHARLAQEQITVPDKTAGLVKTYLQQWMDAQKNNVDAVPTITSFGWHDDRFVVGSKMYEAGKVPATVYTSRGAAAYAEMLTPKGEPEVWKDVINQLYNHPNMEALQFFVLCSFAAPLIKMHGSTGGIVVYGHSDGSGVGKTTAERAMLSVWGGWEELETGFGGATSNALVSLLGTMGNLPMMIDELTNIPSDKVSEFIHMLSQGKGKRRLNRSGGVNHDRNNWETIIVSSGNMKLSDKLSATKGNPDAELARIFEFTLPPIKSPMSLPEGQALLRKLSKNVGSVGSVYAQHLVDNREAVEAALEAEQARLDKICKFLPQERYWSKLLSAVSLAHTLSLDLGLVSFDYRAMQLWMVKTLKAMRVEVKSVVSDPQSRFSRMYSDLSPNLLVTLGDGKNNVEPVVINEPRNVLSGRVVKAPYNPHGNVASGDAIWLMERAVRDWCSKNSIGYSSFLDELRSAGLLVGTSKRALGKGIPKYSALSQVQVLVLDPALVSSNHAPNLLSIQGGLASKV